MTLIHTPAGLRQLHADAEQLWLQLQADCPDISIDVLPEVGSTNTHLMQQGRALTKAGEALRPCVAVAWQQTAGKGRHGRTWQAQPGNSLTMSLGVPMRLDWAQPGASALSLAAGVAIGEALQAALPTLPVQLKWPNDLWVADRKLGGLLIEVARMEPHPSDANALAWLVLGVGLNLQDTPPEWQAERCDLQALGHTCTPGMVMQWLVPALLTALQQFERDSFAAFQTRYAAFDALQGRPVQLWDSTAGQALHADQAPRSAGMAQGVNAHGALLVTNASGGVQAWTQGEVSVRPLPEAMPEALS
jgi:BirA family transcriptional regulator, biotin operon repressor / biotin---[acetyl-CoA-carboxylase] ligase